MISIDYLFTILLATAALAFASYWIARSLTLASIQWGTKTQVVAEVNERSSHTRPVPRVGGIGIMGGILPGFAILAAMIAAPERMPSVIHPVEGAMSWMQWAGWLAALAGTFALGLWDDRADVPAAVKFVAQLAIGAVAPLCGLRFRTLQIPGMGDYVVLSPVAGIILTTFWVLMMMNVVNFMDGINGLAGRFVQFVTVGAFLGPVGWSGSETMLPICATLWGACEGFLVFNQHEAKTFMGDCGSQPLGVMVALLGVHLGSLPTSYPVAIVGYLIMVSVFAFDVLFTLIRRLARGENILRAHREHLYQRHLIATGGNHQNTRLFVEGFLLTTVILGAVYMHFYWRTENTAGQVALITFTIVALVLYLVRVRLVEGAAAKG